MPQQVSVVVDNQFIEGLKTEYTGLNFPDKACIETENCVFDSSGLVSRRLGIDFEDGFAEEEIDRTLRAVTQYHWKNVTGDGTVSLLAVQVGSIVYFYRDSTANTSNPISTQLLVSTVDLTDFIASGAGSVDIAKECQYADGNGYLFIFHPNTDPIYCSYSAGTITGTAITIRTRDFAGITENVDDNLRPYTLSDDHRYNLGNQGWGKMWEALSTDTIEIPAEVDLPEAVMIDIGTGYPITVGDRVRIFNDDDSTIGGLIFEKFMIGTVSDYTAGVLTVRVIEALGYGETFSDWKVVPEPALISTWFRQLENYPSNSDVWWYFKDETDVFNPLDTIDNIAPGAGPAPKGFFILDTFDQDRAGVSGVDSITAVTSGGIRPTTGAWFQGRVWYSGVHANSYHESVYFSQIIENPNQFGRCYQANDPTSEERFDLLPSDGGVIRLQGIGAIHKLFPMTNGLLVFAEKGTKFITGSQGIGFTASDYTIVDVVDAYALSPTSFVDVLGSPMWWNEYGIYRLNSKEGRMSAESITETTIDSFYRDIPLLSKRYARGAYNPITHKLQWIYKSVNEGSVTSRYEFTNALNLDMRTGAFYPWRIYITGPTIINGIVAIGGLGGETSPPFTFKYLTSTLDGATYNFTFSEERDEDYVDFASAGLSNPYVSHFTTGYRIYTRGNTKGQLPYIDVHSDTSSGASHLDGASQCDLQAKWDWTSSGNAGKWSTVQRLVFNEPYRNYQTRRVRLRGTGRAVQLKFSSVAGVPMSLIGWSTVVAVNRMP